MVLRHAQRASNEKPDEEVGEDQADVSLSSLHVGRLEVGSLKTLEQPRAQLKIRVEYVLFSAGN